MRASLVALATLGLLACGGGNEDDKTLDLDACFGRARHENSSMSAEDRRTCEMVERLAESDLADCIVRADGDADQLEACLDDGS